MGLSCVGVKKESYLGNKRPLWLIFQIQCNALRSLKDGS